MDILDEEIILRKGNETIARVEGTPPGAVIDLEALGLPVPRFYAIGVDDAEILGSFATLEEAIAAARAHLEAHPGCWKIDLELQDGELNPLPLRDGGVAIFTLYRNDEPGEDPLEDFHLEEIEKEAIEGPPWLDT